MGVMYNLAVISHFAWADAFGSSSKSYSVKCLCGSLNYQDDSTITVIKCQLFNFIAQEKKDLKPACKGWCVLLIR